MYVRLRFGRATYDSHPREYAESLLEPKTTKR
jgi:hypothetical protein